MKTNLKKRIEGFTIIEVLIVLAIAGLIILIVFLAVPALQRNNRNTQRKSDVSAILGGVSEWVSTHDGALPADAGEVFTVSNIGYFEETDGGGAGEVELVNGAHAALGAAAADDRIVIATGAGCNGAAAEARGARQTAILYLIETSTGFTPTCQGS